MRIVLLWLASLQFFAALVLVYKGQFELAPGPVLVSWAAGLIWLGLVLTRFNPRCIIFTPAMRPKADWFVEWMHDGESERKRGFYIQLGRVGAGFHL